MELSTAREATSYVATQELSSTLWNPKVHYRFHKSPQFVLILSHMNSVLISPSYFSNTHLTIIYPLTSCPS
jgi:hypothetical protein